MKFYKRKRRFFSLLISTLLLLSLFNEIGSTALASEQDITIDNSKHKDIQLDHFTVYRWQRGIPEYSSSTEGKMYPVIMSWDNKYYFKLSHDLVEDAEAIIANWTDDMHYMEDYSTDSDDSGFKNGSFGRPDGRYPHGNYHMKMGYTSSKMDELYYIDFQAMKENGSIYSLKVDEAVPSLIPMYERTRTIQSAGQYGVTVVTERDPVYAIAWDLTDRWFYDTSYTSDGYWTDAGFRKGRNYLTGARFDSCHSSKDESSIIGIDTSTYYQSNGFTWSLYGINNRTAYQVRRWFKTGSEDSHDSGFSYSRVQNALKTGNVAEEALGRNLGWIAKTRFVGGQMYCSFYNEGSYFHKIHDPEGWGISSKVGGASNCRWLVTEPPMVGLGHYGGWFVSYGNVENHSENSMRTKFADNPQGSKYSFVCYYAVPRIMSCLNGDYTVENGQVTNFDEPVMIRDGVQITVKDGGTLSISDLCWNNGTIYVEEGGTLYLQDGACVCRYNDGGHRGGHIISRGLVIVGENAKLCGGGDYGLEFLEGSHVVNYVAMISENFRVDKDHTIENRGPNAYVFHGAGNGVKYHGVALMEGTVTANGYPERAAVDNFYQDTVADNGIYTYN